GPLAQGLQRLERGRVGGEVERAVPGLDRVVGAAQALVEHARGALGEGRLLLRAAREGRAVVEGLDELVPQLLLLVELEQGVEELGAGLAPQGGAVALDRRARRRQALALDRGPLLEQLRGLV